MRNSLLGAVACLSLCAQGCAAPPRQTPPSPSRPPSPSADPSATADVSGRLAFDNGGDIFVLDLTGGGVAQLTSHSAREFNAVWSPDGTQIAYRSGRDDQYEIYLMNADGSEPRNLTMSADRDEWGPTWSPDGRWIAFNSGLHGGSLQQIWAVQPDGAGLRMVSPTYGEFPAWSPDGQWIAFCSLQRGQSGINPDYDIVAVAADGSEERKLTSSSERYEIYPQWSPDGRSLVFESGPVGVEASAVWSMKADGSEAAPIIAEPSSLAVWSPQGDHLAYVNRDGLIALVAVGGGAPSVLDLSPIDGELGFPSWTR